MNKIYALLLFLLPCFGVAQHALAQGGKTTGRAYLGYAKYDDQIWEWDGLSLDHDAKVGCAIVLTREQLLPYIGGTITGLRVGWDTSQQTGTYEGFVRQTFNGEDLTTGNPTTVRYNYNDSNPGWNNVPLTRYEIPADVEQLVVGFTTRLKKDLCAIPLLYPHEVPNSCYLWVEGDVDASGNPNWVDMCQRGTLPILLAIQDTQGSFNFLPVITSLTTDGVVLTETASSGLLRLRNVGSQPINSLELTSRQGEQTFSKNVSLSKAIAVGTASSSIMVPICCFHSGDVEFSITKVNGNELAQPVTTDVPFIGIPDDVAAQYTRRPLVEYYESENSYMAPRYYDEYVGPSLRGKLGRMTFVCQHLDDQFMTGDDDATVLALRLCDGDSSKVSIPAMTIDRAMSTDNLLFQQNATTNPMFDVLLEPYATQTFNAALTHPTFVGVDVQGLLLDGGQTLNATATADIAPGILPAGQQQRMTVYLMEREVETDSQLFWTEEEKTEHQGHYVHANVIREILSSPEGDPIDGDGNSQFTYSTQPDPDWNADNLYLVAFVHRDGALGGKAMHVLNSAEAELTLDDGIRSLATDGAQHPHDATLYDLTGRPVRTADARHGIYVVGGKKTVIR